MTAFNSIPAVHSHKNECAESVLVADKTTYRPVSRTEVSAKWAETSSDCRTDPTNSSPRCRMVSATHEPLKWVFLVIFLVTAGMSNWAVLAYTHDFVPRQALPDILFSLFPEQTWAAATGDFMVTSCLVSLILLLVFHNSRCVILRRVLFVVATLYAMRSCTLLVTQLPAGYENNEVRCRSQVNSSTKIFFSRLFEQTIRLGFQGHEAMLCGDLLFSGHTLVMMSCSLFIAYYLPSKLRLLRFIPYFFAVFGMICMIISRTHYTIDIVIAYWLSSFVFRVYHAYCEVDVYLERKDSVLHGFLICRIVGWLEENIVPGKVENKFSIPFYEYITTTILNQSPGHHKQISIAPSLPVISPLSISSRDESCKVA